MGYSEYFCAKLENTIIAIHFLNNEYGREHEPYGNIYIFDEEEFNKKYKLVRQAVISGISTYEVEDIHSLPSIHFKEIYELKSNIPNLKEIKKWVNNLTNFTTEQKQGIYTSIEAITQRNSPPCFGMDSSFYTCIVKLSYRNPERIKCIILQTDQMYDKEQTKFRRLPEHFEDKRGKKYVYSVKTYPGRIPGLREEPESWESITREQMNIIAFGYQIESTIYYHTPSKLEIEEYVRLVLPDQNTKLDTQYGETYFLPGNYSWMVIEPFMKIFEHIEQWKKEVQWEKNVVSYQTRAQRITNSEEKEEIELKREKLREEKKNRERQREEEKKRELQKLRFDGIYCSTPEVIEHNGETTQRIECLRFFENESVIITFIALPLDAPLTECVNDMQSWFLPDKEHSSLTSYSTEPDAPFYFQFGYIKEGRLCMVLFNGNILENSIELHSQDNCTQKEKQDTYKFIQFTADSSTRRHGYFTHTS